MRKLVVTGVVVLIAVMGAFVVGVVLLHKPDPGLLLFNAAGNGDLETVKSLIQQGVPINYQSKRMWGETPLYEACEFLQADVVQYLVEAGADVNQANIEGETPLMRLTYSGDEAVPIVEYLIAHGANVAAKDKDGNTVFSHAKAEASAPRLLEVLEQASQAQQTNSSK